MQAFISYSREDNDFIDKFAGALVRNEIGVLMDRSSLKALAEWKTQLRKLIRRADVVICVLSPEWSQSETCKWEYEEAVRLGKRLAPVRYRESGPAPIPAKLSSVQWGLFSTPERFNEEVEAFLRALKLDADWSNAHTRYQELAERWLELNRPNTHCLDGQELTDAITWLYRKRPSGAAPTDLQKEFISQSRTVNGWGAKTIRRLASEVSDASGQYGGAWIAIAGGFSLIAVSLASLVIAIAWPFALFARTRPKITAAALMIALAVFYSQSLTNTANMAVASVFPNPPKPDPWDSAPSRYPVNSLQKGVVHSVDRHGFHIELEPGFVGLLQSTIVKGHQKTLLPGDRLDVRILVFEGKPAKYLSLGLP